MSLSPETGSTSDYRFKTIKFLISDFYSEVEIEELFENLELRGAIFERRTENPAWYDLLLPEEMDTEPYFKTLEGCESIAKVELRKVIRYLIPVDTEG